MKIKPLDSRNKMAIHECIMEKPLLNIFLIERLLHGNIQSFGLEEWHGVFVDDQLIAISFSGGRKKPSSPAKLFTGTGSLESCALIAEFQKSRGGFEIAIGEDQWIQSILDCVAVPTQFNFSQDYMTNTISSFSEAIDSNTDSNHIEIATMKDFDVIYKNSGLMIEEDLGYNPCETESEHQKNTIKKRIEDQRILIGKHEKHIVFQIEIGVILPIGCQVGSTYVPREFRGLKYSTKYMREVCRYLFTKTESVNLHVHIDNHPALRCYKKNGFEKIANYRLAKCKQQR